MSIHVRLTDGNVIESDAENNFPALRDLGLPGWDYACAYCPLAEACDKRGDDDCFCLGMFDGFSGASVVDALRSSGAIVETPQ